MSDLTDPIAFNTITINVLKSVDPRLQRDIREAVTKLVVQILGGHGWSVVAAGIPQYEEVDR